MIEMNPGLLVRPEDIVSAELETRQYMNGSSTYLVVRLSDGRTIRREHGFGFNAFDTYDRIKSHG